MSKITVAQAAALLGVSNRRVVAMIKSRILEAEKFGEKVWQVNAESVERRRVKMMKITPEIKAFMDEQLAKGIGIVESGEEDGKGWDRFEFEHEGKIYKGRYYWESEDFIELEIEEK